MGLRALLFALIFCALPARAQWQAGGQPVADESWRGSDGDFGAMLLLTDRPEEFLDTWAHSGAEFSPTIRSVSQAARGETVAAIVVFARCAADPTGRCNADMDFKVLRPNGSVYAERPATQLWKDAPPPSRSVQLGNGQLMFRIEPDDPLGVYQIQVVAHDHVAGRQVALTEKLSVVAAPRR